MVEKRVEMLASRKVEPSVEERLRCLESIMGEVMINAHRPEILWVCPRCGERLADAMVAEKGSTRRDTFVFACPKCYSFLIPWESVPKGVERNTLRFEKQR